MNLFEEQINWTSNLAPLIQKYKGKKHPLNYSNLYQLLVVVLLSANDSDANINNLSPALFNAFPNMENLVSANKEILITYLSNIKNFGNKTNWLLEIGQTVKKDKNIPLTMEGLTALKGIARKSANVIMREMKIPAEGIIVDLHVFRIAPRIGLIPETKDRNKAEKQLMQIFPKSIWGEIGMVLSFHGRETCRPTPKCPGCIINHVCKYYLRNQK